MMTRYEHAVRQPLSRAAAHMAQAYAMLSPLCDSRRDAEKRQPSYIPPDALFTPTPAPFTTSNIVHHRRSEENKEKETITTMFGGGRRLCARQKQMRLRRQARASGARGAMPAQKRCASEARHARER